MESNAQTLLPKEEQHASPGGHLFSQVCSPNVIKIGAARPPSAILHWYANTVGARARVRNAWNSCVVFGADGSDDESLSKRARSNWRRNGSDRGGSQVKKARSLKTTVCGNIIQEECDYLECVQIIPVLFDSLSVRERSHKRIGLSPTKELHFTKTNVIPKQAKRSCCLVHPLRSLLE